MKKTPFIISVSILFTALTFLSYSCKEPDFNEDTSARVNFSTDTVTFDTVFTTIGSTTSRFVVRNPYNKSIKISYIYLAGGSGSNFRLNIDGILANEASDIEILAKDSFYIFVEVTVDPNNDNNPLLLQDSIVFITNGNLQRVILEAWGQDVHFFSDEIIQSQTWLADKPYLIYNTLFVDTGQTLIIEAGAKIHFHRYAQLIVAGSMHVNGTYDNPVIFQGDRLEDLYDSLQGQWDKIWLVPPSVNNSINFAEIRNATNALQVGAVFTNTQVDVTLSNTKLYNNSSYGICAFSAKMNIFNTLVFNCDLADFIVYNGGEYIIGNSTFAGSTNKMTVKSYPLVILLNFADYVYEDTQTHQDVVVHTSGDLVKADFTNCILFDQYVYTFDTIRDYQNPDIALNFNFNHSLAILNTDRFDVSDSTTYQHIIYNQDAKFKNPSLANFELDTLSVAKDAGTMDMINLFPAILNTDLKNNSRISDVAPDMGAYERIE